MSIKFPHRSDVADVLIVVVAKAIIGLLVLASGFRAVSDDDFARVVISQQWVHQPKLDPTGTSWLPLPFWLMGSCMMVVGRSLATARAIAFGTGLVSSVLIWIAATWLTKDRKAALYGAIFAAIFPWSARLGVATVPELPTAALTLLALASLQQNHWRRRSFGALALGMACWCRYEPWFVVPMFSFITLFDLKKTKDHKWTIPIVLPILFPLLWILWNRISHGSSTHFFDVVAAYKRSKGIESANWWRLLEYPKAILLEEPLLFGALFATLLFTKSIFSKQITSHPERSEGSFRLRRQDDRMLLRYSRPLLCIMMQIGGLSISMVQDGAPTHHPERAVLTCMLLAAVLLGHVLTQVKFTKSILHWSGVGLILLATAVLNYRILFWHSYGFMNREKNVFVGNVARENFVSGERILLEVVDYGYFATMASFARPEDIVLDGNVDTRNPIASTFGNREKLNARIQKDHIQGLIALESSLKPVEKNWSVILEESNWEIYRVR